MGNIFCPVENVALLASVARDICPFPNYNPNPLFVNMLSLTSSLQLRDHYTAVQSSLTPKQLEDFTQGLRSTFGREGKVTLGGVGVVALSLAMLFDTLARQVRGEWVSDSEPIPGLFVKDVRGYYPPQVYTISEYLRLVPHIANNPTRMKEETKRYHKQLLTDEECLDKLEGNHTLPLKEDVTVVNLFLSQMFAVNLQIHHSRIKNSTDEQLSTPDRTPVDDVILTLNCDPDTANRDFMAEVQKSDNQTKEAFEELLSTEDKWLQKVAKMEMSNAILRFLCPAGNFNSHIDQREDFDLKANALGKWPE